MMNPESRDGADGMAARRFPIIARERRKSDQNAAKSGEIFA
jgi:hypothetical protein